MSFELSQVVLSTILNTIFSYVPTIIPTSSMIAYVQGIQRKNKRETEKKRTKLKIYLSLSTIMK